MKKHSGFTLIELMVTLAVAVILAVIAVPGFRTIIQNNRATTQANDLLTAMTLARSEAIKRGSNVSVCSVADPIPSPIVCAASNDWATGWIVFTDDGATAGDFDTGTDTLLRVWEPVSSGTTLAGNANNVQYLASGLTTAAANITFTLTAADCTGNNVQTIGINPTGRGHIATSLCP